MAKQLVLFAGLHKTGSTSIQQTCAANKRGVLDAGFLYPEFVVRGVRTDNHSGPLRFMFRKEPYKGGYSSKYTMTNQPMSAIGLGNELREAIAFQLLTPTNILMVAEGASLLTADELSEMKGWFNDRGRQLRVICYVRRLSSWVNSMVSQRVTGYQRLTIKEAVDEFLEISGVIRPRITNIRTVFRDAEFYSYEAALQHRFGPVGFFFEAIGIKQMGKMLFARANQGRSDCATRLISSINGTLGRTYVTGEVNQRVKNDISGLQTIPGAKFSLREDEVAPLMPLLVAENEWLKETLGEEFYDRNLVFRNEPCVWSEESLARLNEVSSTSTPRIRSLISSYLGQTEQRDIRKVSSSTSPEPPTAHRAATHLKRGIELAGLKRFEEALASYNRAIALSPNNANAHLSRGKTLMRLRRLHESLASFDRAIALHPAYAGAYLSRGIVLSDLARMEESLASFDRAVSVKPGYFAAHVNRALVLVYLKRFDEALASYDRAIALKPDDPEPYWRKADLKLLLGDYEEGWRLFEWRWKSKSYETFSRDFAQPLWLGEQSVIGKTLLIHAEAALGDTIQFCRYIPMVQGRGARVLLEVHAPLAALISTLRGDFTVVEKGKPLPDFDFHCPMMSLPLALKTTVETIPATVPYLHADPDKRKSWRHRLGNKTRPRIGVAWSGRIGRAIDRNPCRKRYFELQLLESLLQLPMEFHSLQKEIPPEDADVLATFRQIHAHQEDLNDFSDTAALIQEMDLVISVDTSVAHLAGALGKPMWILLPFATDYRWMVDRSDSPWYPTATLFRQSTIGDWPGVITRVTQRLTEMNFSL